MFSVFWFTKQITKHAAASREAFQPLPAEQQAWSIFRAGLCSTMGGSK
jgi:hypothetical protein